MEQKLLTCYREGNWKEVLEMYTGIKDQQFNNKLYLWVQPSEEDIKYIEEELSSQNIELLYSVGCGTGLLEWLIQSISGVKVIGIEVDRQWWESKYAPPKFIQMVYADESIHLKYQSHSAIMFCYFNNIKAFYQYMENYDGICLIIIGPGPGAERHTDPMPFDPKIKNMGWNLISSKEIQNTNDHIAIYRRMGTNITS